MRQVHEKACRSKRETRASSVPVHQFPTHHDVVEQGASQDAHLASPLNEDFCTNRIPCIPALTGGRSFLKVVLERGNSAWLACFLKTSRCPEFLRGTKETLET